MERDLGWVTARLSHKLHVSLERALGIAAIASTLAHQLREFDARLRTVARSWSSLLVARG